MALGSRSREGRREGRRMREMDGLHARAPTLTKAKTKLSGSTPGWRASRSNRSAALTVPFALTAIHRFGYSRKNVSRLASSRANAASGGLVIGRLRRSRWTNCRLQFLADVIGQSYPVFRAQSR